MRTILLIAVTAVAITYYEIDWRTKLETMEYSTAVCGIKDSGILL